jgi:hypothetical protein
MWDALEKYQPYADADGHGESWSKMCEERTEETARAAARAAYSANAVYSANAAYAAARAVADAAYWSELAIERIEAAIKERNHD